MIGESRRGNGDLARAHGVVYTRRGGDITRPRPEYVFRGPLCGIDYRCPSYLVDWGPQFPRRVRYFLFIARLIARSAPCTFLTPPSLHSSRIPVSLLLLPPIPFLSLFLSLALTYVHCICPSLSLFLVSARPGRFKLFALYGSPMILAIILNSAEPSRKIVKRERQRENSCSSPAAGRDILPSVPFLTSSPSVSVSRSTLDISALAPARY